MKSCCETYRKLGLLYCGICQPKISGEATTHNVTRGRKKRKRKAGAGSAVGVKKHTRTPRGANRGKPRVVVDPYKRGNGSRKRRRKRS